jgi:hypothetical protein
MMLQVIDAMGDKGDCQREHLSRKLAGREKALSDCVIGSFWILKSRLAEPMVVQSPNHKITQ